MIWLWVRQLDARLRALAPFAVAVAAVLVDVLPLLGLGPWGITPFSTLCVVYFWSLYRPDLFGVLAAFSTGIVHDALAGLPLGLTALILLVVRQLVVVQQRFFLARSFPVVWCCFLLMAPVVEIARWLLISLLSGRLFALEPVLLSLLLTVALYPLASLLLTRMHNGIPRLIHAS
ncbi:MAG: rod shape-determining protein MreD [Geminicoccaceae bacterium]